MSGDPIAAIEQIEAEAWAQLYLALPAEHRTRLGCEVKRYGGAVSILTPGADVPSGNRTIGLGLERALTEDQLTEIIASYIAAGVPRWLLDWSPRAQPRSAASLFERHRGRAMTPIVKLWRTLEGASPALPEGAVRVVEIGEEHARTFEKIVAEPLGLPPVVAPVVRSTVGHAHWHVYLAFDGARPVAGSAMFVRGPGAWFGLSATIATDRGRGAQTQLLARRLHDAANFGCTWVSADTQPETAERPNPSLRNMRRAGMDVLYERAKYLFATAQPPR